MDAFSRVLTKSGISVGEIERIVHGTTVATNAVIQRKGAEVVFVTTAGFEDVPFIQRLNRRREYDLQWLKPQPLVKRRHCLGVAERINARGEVVQPMSTGALEELKHRIEQCQKNGAIDSVAVCLLFSYMNPAHELELERMLQEAFPDIQIQQGDQIRIVSPGGGGYGPPSERDPEQVLEDVREGIITTQQAREVYAVVLVEDNQGDWEVDQASTDQLRRSY